MLVVGVERIASRQISERNNNDDDHAGCHLGRDLAYCFRIGAWAGTAGSLSPDEFGHGHFALPVCSNNEARLMVQDFEPQHSRSSLATQQKGVVATVRYDVAPHCPVITTSILSYKHIWMLNYYKIRVLCVINVAKEEDKKIWQLKNKDCQQKSRPSSPSHRPNNPTLESRERRNKIMTKQ